MRKAYINDNIKTILTEIAKNGGYGSLWVHIETTKSGGSFISLMGNNTLLLRDYYQPFPNMDRMYCLFYYGLGLRMLADDLINKVRYL